jgi:hypothetical protein
MKLIKKAKIDCGLKHLVPWKFNFMFDLNLKKFSEGNFEGKIFCGGKMVAAM